MKRIKVLVVDDSLLFREILARGLSSDVYIDVVATAVDPFDARDKIIKYRPDVMTLDVEMPRMNGIEFLRQLMPQYPLPTIVISTVSEAVFDAINAGAVDFVAKPDAGSPQGVRDFLYDLIAKVKTASIARIIAARPEPAALPARESLPAATNKIVAIGASTGGTEAICKLLTQLPPIMPVLIVQHIPPVFSRMFAVRLNDTTQFEVKEAQTGELVAAGRVLVAPGNLHMKIRKTGSLYKVECFAGEKVNGHCPSIDVLFESVAQEAGASSLGVILTGMGHDGAKGLLAMRRRGARTLGQDEKTSVVYGMPKVAFNIGAVEKQAPLDHMHHVICSILRP